MVIKKVPFAFMVLGLSVALAGCGGGSAPEQRYVYNTDTGRYDAVGSDYDPSQQNRSGGEPPQRNDNDSRYFQRQRAIQQARENDTYHMQRVLELKRQEQRSRR